MSDIKKDLEMLYQGTDLEKLEQPRKRISRTDTFFIGFILGCLLGGFWVYYTFAIIFEPLL